MEIELTAVILSVAHWRRWKERTIAARCTRTTQRHSLAASVSAKVRASTKVNADTVVNGVTVSRVDAYGESLFQFDPICT